MVLDAGNSIIKAKISRRKNGEVAFPHAIKPLTETEYSNILTRAEKNGRILDYLQINGKPYLAGESAERHGIKSSDLARRGTPTNTMAFLRQPRWRMCNKSIRGYKSLRDYPLYYSSTIGYMPDCSILSAPIPAG
jgi:hypothetical protein